ncbi:uncharacterized protein C8Q71DRAFT_470692 [Rhodofomes roseus]|uniref:Uncharacterized protein n=1 Tax=Rhodofomes roseus TaxID=34475 RepID=A0ABQ8KNF8_9APHY|nr:uncharacterized protein C8Q71DRAFT_470692 [Rhodofomes roseus]KAH9839959.1 hypothetical protein C8Q71DRAFT_470692 [Rhodofomes roseus]
MGSAQSHVAEALAATLVVAGAAVVYSYKPSSSQAHSDPAPVSVSAAGKNKKNTKKKAGAEPVSPAEKPTTKPTVVQFPPVVPGAFEGSSAPLDTEATPESAPKATKSKKKKSKKANASGAGASRPVDAMSESSATAPESPAAAPARPIAKSRKASTPKATPPPPPTVDTDGSWTRVESKQRKDSEQPTPLDAGTSDAGVTTTSFTGNSSPTATASDEEGDVKASTSDNRRTLAERLLPKPRKTGVDDMLETPDYPSVARVMRIQPGPDDRPAVGFSWADYEDVDDSRGTADDADGEDDGGWGVVKSRGRPKTHKPTTTPTASESVSKKQRQNAAKRDAQKTAKVEAEAERQARLAQHKRELERAKIAEQYSKPSKNVSGGMTAYVDENGKLVWK